MRARLVRKVVAVAVAATALLAGSLTAMVPASAGVGDYVLGTTTSPDGASLLQRWNVCQSAITYRANVTLAGSTRSERRAAVRQVKAAVAQVSDATGIPFAWKGRTRFIPTGGDWAARMPADTEIVVAYVDPRSGGHDSSLLLTVNGDRAAATGGLSFQQFQLGSDAPWQGAATRGYVVINTPVMKRLPYGFGAGSTQGLLLLHELGHTMGLKHATSRLQTMYPVLESKPAARYYAGDLEGLKRVGSRGAVCPVVSDPGNVLNDVS